MEKKKKDTRKQTIPLLNGKENPLGILGMDIGERILWIREEKNKKYCLIEWKTRTNGKKPLSTCYAVNSELFNHEAKIYNEFCFKLLMDNIEQNLNIEKQL